MKKIILFSLLISALLMGQKLQAKNCCYEKATLESVSTKLQPFYKGNKGSLVYVRQIDNQVYWFAERYDDKFASVFRGTLKGDQISGAYHYIPKGEAKGSGTLKVSIADNGRTLKLSGTNFNEQVLIATKLPTKIPVGHRASYRGNTQNNLTGRWHGENTGVTYILDENKAIVGYSRGFRPGNHDRPSFAKVFFGTRTSTGIKIQWVDLPLGFTKCRGEASFKIVGSHFIRLDGKHFPGVNHKRIEEDIKEILP